MKPKNIKQFKKLIERYESITLHDINMAKLQTGYYRMSNIANFLTGFGTSSDCSLCKNIDVHGQDCEGCVYSEKLELKFSCNRGENVPTFYAISSSNDEAQLFKAFKERAEHMMQILKDLN